MWSSIETHHIFTYLQQSGERLYSLTNTRIDRTTVYLLSQYNKSKNESVFDYRFLYLLLNSIIGSENIKKWCIDKNQIEFAKNIFQHRIHGTIDATVREEQSKSLIKTALRDIRDKSRKMDPTFKKQKK